jgi:hypothetical protein
MFRLFNGHPQAISQLPNIKIEVTISTTDPLCIAKSQLYVLQAKAAAV